jgi:hypothetical protein
LGVTAVKESLRVAVLEAIEGRLSRDLPAFVFQANEELPSESHLFAYDTRGPLVLFLMLQFDSIEDRFTLEVAWATGLAYPAINSFLTGRIAKEDVVARDEVRFRLGSVWTDQDVWWDVAKARWPIFRRQGEARVGGQVAMAWKRVTEHAVPLFRTVAIRRGVEAPGLRVSK